MKFLDLLRIAWHYLRHRLLESLVVVLGTALGVGVISAVLGLYSTYVGSMNRGLDNPVWREISIQPNREQFQGFSSIQRIDPETGNSGPQISFKMADIQLALDACPSVDYGYVAFWERLNLGESDRPMIARGAQMVRRGDGVVVAESKTEEESDGESGADRTGNADQVAEDPSGGIPPNATVEVVTGRAVTTDFFGAYQARTAEGALFSQSDVDGEVPVIVLGSVAADQLYPEAEPAEVVGQRIRFNGVSYTIVGVLESFSADDEAFATSIDSAVYLPATLSQVYRFGNMIHSLTFSVRDPEAIDEAAAELERYFSIEYGDQVSVVNRRENYLEQRRRTVPILATIGLISSVGLFVAAINILNLMLARVVRRRKAIGITAALGGSRAVIFRQYLTESLGLGLAGGVVGIGFAALMTRLLAAILQTRGPEGVASGPEIGLTLGTVGLALAVTLAVNLVFAIYPAYKASTVDPVDALRA